MKRNPIYLTLLLATLLFACGEDDGADPVINVGAAPSLTASTDQLVLAREQADQTAASFSWDAVDYGFPAAVGYALAFDQPTRTGLPVRARGLPGLESGGSPGPALQ